MKKNFSFLGIALVAIMGIFFLSGCFNTSTAPLDSEEDNGEDEMSEQMEDKDGEKMMDDKDMKDGEDTMKDGEGEAVSDGPDDTDFVIGSESSVTYSAQKKWLKKPTQAVEGTNGNVEGNFSYNEQAATLTKLSAKVDSQTFSSGSGGRDKEVQQILTGDIVISSTGAVSGIGPGTFSKTIPLEVTINGVSNTVSFAVQGSAASDSFSATGDATIDLESYNIKPFSVLGLYEVDKMLGISFELSAA